MKEPCRYRLSEGLPESASGGAPRRISVVLLSPDAVGG